MKRLKGEIEIFRKNQNRGSRKPDFIIRKPHFYTVQLMQPIYRFVEIALGVMWAPLGRLLAYFQRQRNHIEDSANEFVAERENMANCVHIGNSRSVIQKRLVE